MVVFCVKSVCTGFSSGGGELLLPDNHDGINTLSQQEWKDAGRFQTTSVL